MMICAEQTEVHDSVHIVQISKIQNEGMKTFEKKFQRLISG